MSTACGTVECLTDTDLEALIRCASRRLIVIAPGVSEHIARALVETWEKIGVRAVQIVLDADPEVCRLGFGEPAALPLLHAAAARMGGCIHQQQGLRIGLVVTDETTVIYAPTPLLVEAGGQPGERPNAIRLETSLIPPKDEATPDDVVHLNLQPKQIQEPEVRAAERDLKANPPIKFDLARRVRVFNAQFEFVDFELRGMAISRKRVSIPSDLTAFASDPVVQKRFHGVYQLIGEFPVNVRDAG